MSNASKNYVTLNHQVIPLSPKGLLQASKIPDLIEDAPDLIVVSPFLRTRQTAAPTIAKFPDVEVVEWPVFEFTFLSPSVFSNSNAAGRRPYVKDYWAKCDPQYCDGDGAESFIELIERVKQARESIKKSGRKFVAIFSHGQFIEASMWFEKYAPDKIGHEEMMHFYAFMKANMVGNAAKIEFLM